MTVWEKSEQVRIPLDGSDVAKSGQVSSQNGVRSVK